METKTIVRINGIDIIATEDGMVPIKPICDALGIDYSRQLKKIKEEEDLSPVMGVTPTTGADGKRYDMCCLPHEFIYGWLFTINPKNVKPEAKENVRKYRMECYKALFRHFFKSQERRDEQDRMEKHLIREMEEIDTQMGQLRRMAAETKKKLEKLREERLKNEPMLF